jgi:hypothetical protein
MNSRNCIIPASAAFGAGVCGSLLLLKAGATKKQNKRAKNRDNGFLGQLEGSESDINYVVLVQQSLGATTSLRHERKVGFKHVFEDKQQFQGLLRMAEMFTEGL